MSNAIGHREFPGRLKAAGLPGRAGPIRGDQPAPSGGRAQLLRERLGRRGQSRKPHLDVRRILRWADAHYRRTGRWPNRLSGPIKETHRETWGQIDGVLSAGGRGIEGKTTLARLLRAHRGAGVRVHLPWTAAEEAQLGTMPDAELAQRLGRSLEAVRQRRRARGIPACVRRRRGA